VNVADRPWVLRASTPAEALRDRRSIQSWAWLAAGLLVTALAARVVRSDRAARELLRNVLPEGIAKRLAGGRRRIADRHDDVTVLFADIVGFTLMATQLPPDELVRLLDDLFSRFDRITDAHGVEKIKTIGDCYMCVGGLDAAPEATLRIVRAAIEMMEVAAQRGLTMRIGVHRGPVISGVIGRRRLAYDLWGDTVNVASRMETFGLPGRVALSDAAYAAIEGRVPCERREAVSMKGLGERASWLVAV
jgi:class 3 adenylate cyclase